jgi:hypothetical protein
MRLGAVLSVIAVAAALALAWMLDQRSQTVAISRAWENPVTPAPASKPVEAPKPAKHAAVVKAIAAAKPVEPPPPVIPAPAPAAQPAAVPEPPPRPFPDAADIPVGVQKTDLKKYHEPTARLLSMEGGEVNETLVYCSGGPTDTYVRLRDGRVVERFDTQHIAPIRSPDHWIP